jgi:membrane protein DedA with SNARE-associated domain
MFFVIKNMFEGIILGFLEYYLLIGFIGSIFVGEMIIIPLGIISAQSDINSFFGFLSCYVGVFLADYSWFLIGKYNLIQKIFPLFRYLDNKKLPRNFRNLLLKKTFYSMILIKFAYGFRILAILYLGNRFKKTKEFLLYNSVAVFLGTGSVFILGWLIGKGIGNFIEFFDNLRMSITIILISTIILIIIIKRFEKWFTKKEIAKR